MPCIRRFLCWISSSKIFLCKTLTHCSLVTPHMVTWISVNAASDNGLLPDAMLPSNYPSQYWLIIRQWDLMAFTFTWNAEDIYPWLIWKCLIQYQSRISHGSMVKIIAKACLCKVCKFKYNRRLGQCNDIAAIFFRILTFPIIAITLFV